MRDQPRKLVQYQGFWAMRTTAPDGTMSYEVSRIPVTVPRKQAAQQLKAAK